MIEIYLTRHGETLENAQGILQGHQPGHLSHLGIEQAESLRDKLADTHFDNIVVSDLQRAIDTARILNEPHGLRLTQTHLLRERDWGVFTGQHITDIRILPKDFPPSVESPLQLQQRARIFLRFLLKHFEGQTILAVGHGYFNRCILAEFYGKSPHDIPRWGNTEVRKFTLHQLSASAAQSLPDSEVSAD